MWTYVFIAISEDDTPKILHKVYSILNILRNWVTTVQCVSAILKVLKTHFQSNIFCFLKDSEIAGKKISWAETKILLRPKISQFGTEPWAQHWNMLQCHDPEPLWADPPDEIRTNRPYSLLGVLALSLEPHCIMNLMLARVSFQKVSTLKTF